MDYKECNQIIREKDAEIAKLESELREMTRLKDYWFLEAHAFIVRATGIERTAKIKDIGKKLREGEINGNDRGRD